MKKGRKEPGGSRSTGSEEIIEEPVFFLLDRRILFLNLIHWKKGSRSNTKWPHGIWISPIPLKNEEMTFAEPSLP